MRVRACVFFVGGNRAPPYSAFTPSHASVVPDKSFSHALTHTPPLFTENRNKASSLKVYKSYLVKLSFKPACDVPYFSTLNRLCFAYAGRMKQVVGGSANVM